MGALGGWAGGWGPKRGSLGQQLDLDESLFGGEVYCAVQL
jgi:hypothetical protein